jgi:hypothetical protein
MKPTEIISQSIRNDGNDPTSDLNALSLAKQRNSLQMLQENNTVLAMLRLGRGDVEIHLYSVDSPLLMARALTHFIKKIRSMDINAVYGKPDNTNRLGQTLKLLEKLGVEVLPSDRPKYQWMAKV